MAIVDLQNQFADAQALSASGASTNIIDTGVAGDVGSGEELFVVIQVNTAADATDGNETYSVAVQEDSSAGFGSATDILTRSVPRGQAANSQIVLPLPPNSKRYLRLNWTLGGTTPSITYTAFLAHGWQQVQNYASGFSVS